TNVHHDGYRRYLYGHVDPLEHFAWPDTDVVAEPVSIIRLRPDAAKSKYSFDSIANNVGFVPDYSGNIRDVRLQLEPRAMKTGKQRTLEITVAGAGDAGGQGILVVQSGERLLHEVSLRQLKPGSLIRVPLPEAAERITLQVSSKK